MAFTYWYRDWQTLEAAADAIVPQLTRRRSITVWDAGCANGPEPYTLAMILRQRMGHFIFRNLRIYASDIDESNQFAEQIRQGVFRESDLRRIPKDVYEQSFGLADKAGYRLLDRELRNVVRFQRHDLLTLEPIRTGFNLIVCKNVLLHFAPAKREQVLRMFHQALAPNGFLVVEQTQKLPASQAEMWNKVCPAAQVYQKARESSHRPAATPVRVAMAASIKE